MARVLIKQDSISNKYQIDPRHQACDAWEAALRKMVHSPEDLKYLRECRPTSAIDFTNSGLFLPYTYSRRGWVLLGGGGGNPGKARSPWLVLVFQNKPVTLEIIVENWNNGSSYSTRARRENLRLVLCFSFTDLNFSR